VALAWSASADAQVVTEFPLPVNVEGESIAAGPDGALWFWGPSLGQITTSGSLTLYRCFFAGLCGISGFNGTTIVAGPDGALWFVDDSNIALGRTTTSGVITEFATPSQPVGIATGPDGALWFTETNGKIGRMTTTGAVNEYPVPPAPDPRDLPSFPAQHAPPSMNAFVIHRRLES
jgi:virginiamycin B lyase